MATRSYSAQQIKESGAVTLLDILQRIPGMYLVGQRVWYRGKQPAFMIDGIVEYTPKMLMNYGLTAGRVRDKSVDEMKEELRQKDNPQVNVNNLKNHTFTPLGEAKGSAMTFNTRRTTTPCRRASRRRSYRSSG